MEVISLKLGRVWAEVEKAETLFWQTFVLVILFDKEDVCLKASRIVNMKWNFFSVMSVLWYCLFTEVNIFVVSLNGFILTGLATDWILFL